MGEHELVPGQAFDLLFTLPEGSKPRRGVNVRLETSDYVYAGPNRQHMRQLRLGAARARVSAARLTRAPGRTQLTRSAPSRRAFTVPVR